MRNYFVIALLLLAVARVLSGQIPEILNVEQIHFETKGYCSHIKDLENMNDEVLANPVVFRPYDVLHYDIFLDWYDMMNKPMKLDSNGFGYITEDDVVWSGQVKISLKVDTTKLSILEFDSRELRINKVLVNDKEILPIPPVVGNVLKIQLDTPAVQDEFINVTINYVHDKWLGADQFRGFYLYPKSQYLGKIPVEPQDSAFIEERLAYTMNEPQNARFWLPSNDSPHDKATVTMKVRVPRGYSVASNGLLKEIIKNDSAWTHHWHSSDVMTTYLIHAAASIFKEWSEWYKKVTNPNDSIEIKYFTWQKDYDADKKDGSQYNARWTFEQNVEQMEAFSTAFGEYPFEKYGIVSLQQFGFGGMEHQTITSINRVWLRQNARWGLAHELGHMWMGDLVTCKTWNDIWVNEGGATWSEAVWSNYDQNFDAYLWNMLGKRDAYFRSGGSQLPPIYGLPINTIFGRYAVLVYQKSSWIYHQLRMMLGDEVFFPALQSLFAKYANTSIDHLDYIKSFTEDVPNSPIDFDIYFSQWLMKSGHPQLSMSVTTNNAGGENNIASVSISQIQEPDEISDIFEIPIRVVFKDSTGNFLADTLWQYERTIEKNVELSFFPSEIYIDTTFTLCEVINSVTDVQTSEFSTSTEIFISPNPIFSGNIGSIELKMEDAQDVKIILYNILGKLEQEIYSGSLNSGTYRLDFDTKSLQPGAYWVRLISAKRTIIEQVIVL